MEKVLRSLIHEKFDLDLRVEIEFLSRRRDLVNKEKQEELIKLLQSRNISNIVPLGPGTNRYAFKLDGFVIKVATDHDGKIDNLKEFKMAKRLYPYVTKTYEVSENGTLLVAEYIQPFESFSEMCKYAEKIRDILTKLSSVYLIGDVGITPNNFANWGLRVGTEDPVCLDFAYVYEVSSSLFLCRYCDAHAMLAPNRDFTELHCTNPACQRKYLFEDIRARIGNDVHNHEIGDLSLEGYKLFSSGVQVELSSERSNYLLRKKNKEKPKKVEVEEVPFVDNFVMDQPLDTIKGGISTMSRIDEAVKVAAALSSKPIPGVLRVQAKAVPAAVNVIKPTQVIHEPDPEPASTAPVGDTETAKLAAEEVDHSIHDEMGRIIRQEQDGTPTDMSGLKRSAAVLINNSMYGVSGTIPEDKAPVRKRTVGTLAFAGEMTSDDDPNPKEDHPPAKLYTEPQPPVTEEKKVYATIAEPLKPEEPKKPIVATATIATPPVTPVQEETSGNDTGVETPASDSSDATDYHKIEFQETPPRKTGEKPQSDDNTTEKHQFEHGFLSTMRDVVSKLSNHIGRQIRLDEVYDELTASIQDKKMYKDSFYLNVQSAVFRSLVKFMNFTERVEPKNHGKGTRHIFIPPTDPNGSYEPTLIFIERLWQDHLLDKYDIDHSVEMMEEYRAKYTDYLGIQQEWLEALANRINSKMPIDIIGSRKVAELVKDLWCAPIVEEKAEESEPASEPEATTEPVSEEPKDITDEEITNVIKRVFEDPSDDGVLTELQRITNSPREWDLVKEALKEFGLKNYNAPLQVDNLSDVVLTQFKISSCGNEWGFKRHVDMENLKVWDTIVGEDPDEVVCNQKFNSRAKLIMFLAIMDLNIVVEHYRSKVEDIIKSAESKAAEEPKEEPIAQMYPKFIEKMTPAEAAAQILQAAQMSEEEEEAEEEYEETPGIVVHVFYDETFDIIKVSSDEAFGLVSIPFYTKLDAVKLDNAPPSLVDDRNGVWDWMTHMVPDMMFLTARPEYFMKINDEGSEPEQAKILILDEDHGTYTMGIYWLRGIFVVDDDDEEQPCYDPEFLAKINRIICEDVGYGRISHLRRTLSMDELIKPEEYVVNHVITTEVVEDEDEGGDEDMNSNMNAAEAAALSIIMNGSKVLPEGSTDAQKEFADQMHQQAFNSLGIPESAASAAAETVEESQQDQAASGDSSMDIPAEPEVEETFEMAGDPKPEETSETSSTIPGVLPVVSKQAAPQENNLPKGVFQPVRRKH